MYTNHVSTFGYKSWHGCMTRYANGEASTSIIVLQLDAVNVSDSEEASSLESDSDVVHLQCEEEKDVSHSEYRTDNGSINESEMSTF